MQIISSISNNSVLYKNSFFFFFFFFLVYTQLNVKTVLFQEIQFSTSTVSMSKTFLFQTIQFRISTWFKSQNRPISNNSVSHKQFTYVWAIDRTLAGATTPGQSGLGSDVNEVVLRVPQSFSITEDSPSDYLSSYTGHSLEGGGTIYQPLRSGRIWHKVNF